MTGNSNFEYRPAPLHRTLRRRRDTKAGLTQAVYMVVGATVGFFLAGLNWGPMVSSGNTNPLLLGIAGGLITFVALVFSLLFLVVQYGNTSVSPRLTLFHEDPLVWHGFGFFMAIFTFTATAAIRSRADAQVSVIVPALAVAAVLAALVLARSLQLRALRLMQFNSIMEIVRRRGEDLFRALYGGRPTETAGSHVDGTGMPVVWNGATTLLRQIDLNRLAEEAESRHAVVVMSTMIGTELRRGQVFAEVFSDRPVEEQALARTFLTGFDRNFAQDPLLAFRLLTDIGDRSLSAAINDPATAVQAIGCVYDLLAMIADKNLDPGPLTDSAGQPRVYLRFPTWEEFVAAGIDEFTIYSSDSPVIRARLVELVDDLLRIAPRHRHQPLQDRRRVLTEATA